MDVILPDEELKKSLTVYEDFASSHQTFDEIRRLEAKEGFVILRGKNGRPDKRFPLARISQRFFRWYKIYLDWMRSGFTSQCDELRYVLEDLGAAIQLAIVQRTTDRSPVPVPGWVSPMYMAQLNKAVLSLKSS